MAPTSDDPDVSPLAQCEGLGEERRLIPLLIVLPIGLIVLGGIHVENPEGRKKPRGYGGHDHETIGSDILAVFQTLKNPEAVLSPGSVEKLRGVDAKAWYPIGWLLDLLNEIADRVGRYALLRIGRTVFRESHAAAAKGMISSARDLFEAMDGLYHRANRGASIGGWKVARFAPGIAELEKNTPHYCAMEEGIVLEALTLVGVHALIEQPECMLNGADICRFVVTSAVVDERWTGHTES